MHTTMPLARAAWSCIVPQPCKSYRTDCCLCVVLPQGEVQGGLLGHAMCHEARRIQRRTRLSGGGGELLLLLLTLLMLLLLLWLLL